MLKPLPVIFLSIFFFPTISCTYGNNSTWKEIVKYFTDHKRTSKEVLDRLSIDALQSIIPQPTPDSAKAVVDLFKSLEDSHDYKVDTKSDTIRISFNPNAEIAGGPFFDIVKSNNDNWHIIHVYFGK